jgi:DNA-binding transcriptional LysR family regulator
MEIQQARVFVAVAEELHFRRAAARLHLTQSALSRSLAQLERGLGARLVDRTTRTVSLTAAGEALLPHAQQIVLLVERTEDLISDAVQGRTGRVRLGFSGPSTNHVVGRLAHDVRVRMRGINLELISAVLSHHGLDRLLSCELDLALGRWDFLPAEIESRVIAREQLVVAMPLNHRQARVGCVPLPQLAKESWISLPSGPGAALPQRLSMLATQADFVPRITHVTPDSATSLVLVAAGYGVALTQSSVRDNIHAPGVVFRPLCEDPPPLEVRLAWRRDDTNPALGAVVDISRELLPDE